ncbi:hypothetical protein C3F09_07570, partial [candidate division GN15 bacterium]
MNAFGRLVIIAVLAVSARAYSSDSGNGGRESLFSLGSGAASLGMGGAFTAMGRDASTVYYNPAGLPWLNYQEFTAMHATLFDGTLYDAASWGVPLIGVGGLGASFMRVGTGDIIRRANFVNEGTFRYATWQFLIGYGRKLNNAVSVGGTFKIVNQSLDNQSDYGLGADLGMQALVYRGLRLGLAARNVAPPMLQLDSTSDQMPLVLVVGLSVQQVRLSDFIGAAAAFDLEKTASHPYAVRTGIEFTLGRTLALRGGYDRTNFSFGAGVFAGRLKFDYAYKIMDEIEDSHRLSLSLLLGPSIATQLERRELEAQRRSTRMYEDERKRQMTANRQKADEFYRELRLDSALTYYQRALAFDEKNQEIIGTIAAIENIQRIKAEEEARIRAAEQEQQQTLRAYFDQASFLYDHKYYPAALDLLNLIFEIDPDNADARELKGKIEAAESAEIVTARNQCVTAEREGRLLDAVDACNRVLELAPGDSVALQTRQQISTRMDVTQLLRRGIDLYNQNRMAEARRQF